MNIEDIIRLWHKTQKGHINECRKNQIIFSEIMWTLHGKLEENDLKLSEYQSHGDEPI